eukprot:1389029-Lingulodinium_polyedra.AAC.1
MATTSNRNDAAGNARLPKCSDPTNTNSACLASRRLGNADCNAANDDFSAPPFGLRPNVAN